MIFKMAESETSISNRQVLGQFGGADDGSMYYLGTPVYLLVVWSNNQFSHGNKMKIKEKMITDSSYYC